MLLGGAVHSHCNRNDVAHGRARQKISRRAAARRFTALPSGEPGARLADRNHADGVAREGLPNMIVDSQVHLWKAETPDWRWVPGRVPQLPEPFTIERLVPLMNEAGVDRAVIVPPSWPGDRNDYALEAVRRYPGRLAVMGRIPLEKPQSAALLSKWRRRNSARDARSCRATPPLARGGATGEPTSPTPSINPLIASGSRISPRN